MMVQGCRTPRTSPANQPPVQRVEKGYTSAFPNRDISEDLDEIRESVKKIIVSGLFHTYRFEDGTSYTATDLRNANLKSISSRSIVHDESSVGTAISLAENNRFIILLTCAHVIQLPDTLYSYRKGENIPRDTYVETITVKVSQNNLIFNSNNVTSFEVSAIDRGEDLALIRVNKLRAENSINAPPLRIKTGNPRELKWGSFIYILGYPKGFSMVTRGIVSDPNRNREGGFLTDALFNRGISGGLIIAARGPNYTFDWIGIASTASASKETYLVPNPDQTHLFQRFEVYSDSLFIDTKNRIDYGITQPISITTVKQFLKENEDIFRKSGFNLEKLID